MSGSENVSGSVLENYKINSIYGIKNYSYIIKVSGSRRGIGVTHTVLSMAHCLGDYGFNRRFGKNGYITDGIGR